MNSGMDTDSMVFMLLAIALDMLFPQITKIIVNEVIVDRDFSRFAYLLAAIVAIGLGRSGHLCGIRHFSNGAGISPRLKIYYRIC